MSRNERRHSKPGRWLECERGRNSAGQSAPTKRRRGPTLNSLVRTHGLTRSGGHGPRRRCAVGPRAAVPCSLVREEVALVAEKPRWMAGDRQGCRVIRCACRRVRRIYFILDFLNGAAELLLRTNQAIIVDGRIAAVQQVQVRTQGGTCHGTSLRSNVRSLSASQTRAEQQHATCRCDGPPHKPFLAPSIHSLDSPRPSHSPTLYRHPHQV